MQITCENCECKFEGAKDTKTCSRYCKEQLKIKKKQQNWVALGSTKSSYKPYKNSFKVTPNSEY